MILALLQGVFMVKDVVKVDINLDGKKEEVQLRVWPQTRVDVKDIKAEPRYDVEVLVKDGDRILKAGTIEGIRSLRPIRHWIFKNPETGGVDKVVLVFKADDMYWGLIYPYALIHVPRELLP